MKRKRKSSSAGSLQLDLPFPGQPAIYIINIGTSLQPPKNGKRKVLPPARTCRAALRGRSRAAPQTIIANPAIPDFLIAEIMRKIAAPAFFRKRKVAKHRANAGGKLL